MAYKKYLILLRPHQWVKNLLLFFPAFFGGKLLEPGILSVVLPSFFSFSLVASSGYILNDILDREYDRCHATKKTRPIAHGDVSVVTATILAIMLCLTALLVSSSISRHFEGILIIYFFVSFLYTIYFKNLVIIDIFFVSFGFLIRVVAGGEAFHVTISNWFFLTVFMVSLFLAAGKRLGELISQGEDAGKQRQSLNHYSESFLEGILWSSAASALISYALYIIENRGGMLYTVPLAAFGLFRYIYIVKKGKGDPTEALLKDGQIMATGVLWAIMIGVIIYRK